MKTVETENEGLKRAYTLTIPAKDIDARVEGEVKRIAPTVRMPGFRPGKVPPNLIRKMHESPAEVVLWGDGTPTREFLYVEDAAEAFVLAAERYDGPEPVNIGAGREISIRDLAELVAELTGFAGAIRWDESMPNGQPRRSLDASRAKELFGFEARTPLREGLERTIAWYNHSRLSPGMVRRA